MPKSSYNSLCFLDSYSPRPSVYGVRPTQTDPAVLSNSSHFKIWGPAAAPPARELGSVNLHTIPQSRALRKFSRLLFADCLNLSVARRNRDLVRVAEVFARLLQAKDSRIGNRSFVSVNKSTTFR